MSLSNDARKVAFLIGVTVSVAAILFVVAFGYIVVAQPGCASCHGNSEFRSASAATAHSQIPCTSCHGAAGTLDRVRLARQQMFGMYLKITPVDPSASHVSNATCLRCHGKLDQAISVSSGLRIKHSKCAVGRNCTDCHSATAHGKAVSWPKTATMESCFSCHGANGPTTKCNACHEAKLPSDRIKTGSFSVTHGPNYRKTHGLGEMKMCSACHEPAKCANCHGPGVPHDATFVVTHGTYAKQPSAKCLSCHQKTFCLDCHRYPMPHPSSFVHGHSKIVKTSGDAACRRCHDKSDCDNCHLKHIHPTTTDELQRLRGSRVGTVTP